MIRKVVRTIISAIIVAPLLLVSSFTQAQGVPDSIALFQENCAVCHGESLEGAPQGAPLLGDLTHGDAMADIVTSISKGYADAGMPAWQDNLTRSQIRNVALYVLETRANVNYRTFNHELPLEIPTETIESTLHSFRLETVAEGLDNLPFSIAPLPDGRILLTEKKYGVRIIGIEGKVSKYLTGTPDVYADTATAPNGNERGLGWLFDIAPHPDYADNGWIYLYYGDRCEDCNTLSRARKRPVSMNKLVRGRIDEGTWVDQETIWEADLNDYGAMIDVGAGGRITFDNSGHIFLSVGMKGFNNNAGIQDLSRPWGKIHRINDDGSIPDDNPFADRDDVYRSIFTLGHRSPQGLEFDLVNGELWGTEHGPRGGDELNRLIPGENYGWPLFSLGMDYDGTPVEYGRDLGIAYELSDIQQPVLDLTPSPAVSSFIISSSDQFPDWEGDFLVGSLKARSLFRIEIDNNQFVKRETLLGELARIRDIEQGPNGGIYLLLEHITGGRVVRLVPTN